MTGTVVRTRETQDYIEGVAAALADLPDEDRADLLDELGAHLDELTAESDASLVARLGTPAHYAAELRASAGLPTAVAQGPAGRRLAAWARGLGARREVAVARSFVGSLRPVWWVLRAWVLVGAVAMWPGQTTPAWSGGLPFVPRVVTPEVGLIVLTLAVWASIQLGRRAFAAPRRAVIAVNLVAGLLALPVVASCTDQANNVTYVESGPQTIRVVPREGVFAAGRQVWNIYAYDAAGRMLHDVRLYAQDGTPLSLRLRRDGTRKPVVDQQGRLVDNAYPYRYVEADGTVANPDAGPAVDAPPLVGVPTASALPTPTASTAPTGKARKG